MTAVLINDADLISTLAESSADGGLRYLRIDVETITYDELAPLIPNVLCNLTSLSIVYNREFTEENLGRLLALCPQLEKLKLMSTHYNEIPLAPILQTPSTSLKTIKIDACSSIDRPTLTQLFAKHPNLCELDIAGRLVDATSVPYDIISEMLPNLKMVHFNLILDRKTVADSNGMSHLLSLKHLKELLISVRLRDMPEFCNYLSMAEGLHTLTVGFLFECEEQFGCFINAICSCESLRKLYILHEEKSNWGEFCPS